MSDPIREREAQLRHHRKSQEPQPTLASELQRVLEQAQDATARSGWERQDAEALRAQREAEQSERARWLRRAGVALHPEMHRAVVTDTLDLTSTKPLRAVARWRALGFRQRPAVVVLSGNTGTGKSTAAGWWLAQTGGHLERATALATSWDSSTVRAQERREMVCDTACLVLDDVGSEPARFREAMGEALREVIEARQAAWTVITTNLSREQWSKRYPDERLASRMQRCSWVVCPGEDLRGAR